METEIPSLLQTCLVDGSFHDRSLLKLNEQSMASFGNTAQYYLHIDT
jgi:hypothetical protein